LSETIYCCSKRKHRNTRVSDRLEQTRDFNASRLRVAAESRWLEKVTHVKERDPMVGAQQQRALTLSRSCLLLADPSYCMPQHPPWPLERLSFSPRVVQFQVQRIFGGY
jgi:hypothetical protein